MHINSHSSNQFFFVADNKNSQYQVAISLDPFESSVDLSDVANIPPEVGDELIRANIDDLFDEIEG